MELIELIRDTEGQILELREKPDFFRIATAYSAEEGYGPIDC